MSRHTRKRKVLHLKRSVPALYTGLIALCAVSISLTHAPVHARPTFGGGPAIPTIPDGTEDLTGIPSPGVGISDIVLSGTGVSITELQSVTLVGFQHTSAGDLQVRLEKVGSGIEVFLTAPRESIIANLDGTYTLTPNLLLSTMEEGLDILSDDGTLVSGNYAPADFGGGPPFPGERTDFSAFDGVALDGIWRLTIEDYLPGNTGSLQGWSFDAVTPAVVPEMPTGILFPLSLIALVGVARLRSAAPNYRFTLAGTSPTR